MLARARTERSWKKTSCLITGTIHDNWIKQTGFLRTRIAAIETKAIFFQKLLLITLCTRIRAVEVCFSTNDVQLAKAKVKPGVLDDTHQNVAKIWKRLDESSFSNQVFPMWHFKMFRLRRAFYIKWIKSSRPVEETNFFCFIFHFQVRQRNEKRARLLPWECCILDCFYNAFQAERWWRGLRSHDRNA